MDDLEEQEWPMYEGCVLILRLWGVCERAMEEGFERGGV